MAPASMAKLATVLVAFEEIGAGRLTLDSEISISTRTPGARAVRPPAAPTMFAMLNSRIKLSDILHGIIVQSGNDASIALAEAIAGDEATFGRVMTERVRAIGLTKSVFRNATGMADPQQRVTARELARLAEHIIKTYPEQYKIFGERDFTWNKIEAAEPQPAADDGYWSGWAEDRQYRRIRLRARRLGGPERPAPDRRGQRPEDGSATARTRARKLLEWGFRAFERRQLFASGEIVGEDERLWRREGRVALRSKAAVGLLVPRGSSERLAARIVYRGPLMVPVQEGRRSPGSW